MKNNRNSEQYIAAYCKTNGLRFTDQRRDVYRIVNAAEQPIGAYDILEILSENYDRPKATTVYRALDFLKEHHFIHKIESLNAFVVCSVDHEHPGSQFMICNDCGVVDEVHLCHIPSDLKTKIDGQNFNMKYWNTEIHGVCNACHRKS